ncbi:MAG: hypothetical protein VKI81_05840 [Synechococcaceae cyanobacterium]|nr:hypothetical protein [Synechococcaceae cyanobacterium]
MLKDILDLIIALFRSQQTQRSAVLAIPLTVVPFIVLGALFNVSPRDHWNYLTSRDSNLMRGELAGQMAANNANIEQYTFISFDKQQELAHLLRRENQNMASSEAVRKALENSSDNYELIRSLLEFGTIYRDMVHAGINDDIAHDILSELFEGIVLVNQAKKTEPRQLGCRHMEEGYRTFSSLNNRVDILPSPVGDETQVEILRYLTYAASFMRQCRLGEGDEQGSRAYANAQRIYTDRAQKLKERQKDIRASEYLRKYFWIDYSLLVRHVNTNTPQDTAEGDRTFDALMWKLPPEFLRDKMLQHRELIDPSRRPIWDRYRQRL